MAWVKFVVHPHPNAADWWVPFSGSYHPAADSIRLVLLGAGVFVLLVVFRVAYLRFQSANEAMRNPSGWGMVSYAGFILVAVYDGLHRFGEPFDWVRIVLVVSALVAGVIAVFTTVTFRPFGYRNASAIRQRLADEREGRAAREAREDRDR